MNAGRRRTDTAVRMKGGPLVILVLLLAGWCSARVWWWEPPFAASARVPSQIAALGPRGAPLPPIPVAARVSARTLSAADASLARGAAGGPLRSQASRLQRANRAGLGGHRLDPGMSVPSAPSSAAALLDQGPRPSAPPPLLPAPIAVPRSPDPGRWSLDAWMFWREGSSAAPVSQGRVPIYGASQAGALLQYRLAPGSGSDPRLHARAYRALVMRGESELALGASLRVLPRVPLRTAAELRYTDFAVSNALRPAVYTVTELAPLRLPLGTRLEAYGQAGWVGGPGATPFADGLASATAELPQAGRMSDNALRLSLGAAAWGGAQRGAQRVDVGPTLRLDMRLGEVPARLTIDWRERVAGDAAPGSGVSATLSTGF